MKGETPKHPDVLAWEKFKEDRDSLFRDAPTGEYLANRLWHAFMAGRESQRKELEESILSGKRKVYIGQLKRDYPHPRRGCDDTCTEDSYCVGGALCYAVGIDVNFPDFLKLKEAVLLANPRICVYEMTDAENDYLRLKIDSIIAANDQGLFKQAWDVLAGLLRWKPRGREFSDALRTAK